MQQGTFRNLVDMAAYGGPGWAPRGPSLRDELGTLWSPQHVCTEWEPLRAVLLHRPGQELELLGDPDLLQMADRPDPARLREEIDQLAEVYRNNGVAVHWVEPEGDAPPNLVFCRDIFAMTPEGAIVSRMASRVRAGEERHVARRLAALGVPILLTVRGPGTFEGAAELLWVDRQTVLLSQGLRTNAEGAHQVESLLQSAGVEVHRAGLPVGAMHLLGTLNFIGPDLALAWPGCTPYAAIALLRARGFRILFLPSAVEREVGMALNFVTLRRNRVLMPAGCPQTRELLESAGVECLELAVPELIKAEGAIACATGVLWREREVG